MATGPYIDMKRHSDPPTHASRQHSLRTANTKRVCTLLLICFVLYLLTSLKPRGLITNTGLVLEPLTWDAARDPSENRITKATILNDDYSNDILARNLRLHEAQGYDVHVLRKQIVNGYADQFLWLHEIIVKELRKPSEVRAEWIVFFDLSSVVQINPIPLHTFLPPLPSTSNDSETYKSLSIIATKPDSHAISPNLLFLRVHGLTLRILLLALTAPYTEPAREWGQDVSAGTLQYVLEDEKFGMRDKAVFLPPWWFNSSASIFTQPWASTPVLQLYEVDNVLNRKQGEHAPYPSASEVDTFWAAVTEAKRVLNEARDRGYTETKGPWQEDVRRLKYTVDSWTWNVNRLRGVTEIMKGKLGIGDVVGFEPVYG